MDHVSIDTAISLAEYLIGGYVTLISAIWTITFRSIRKEQSELREQLDKQAKQYLNFTSIINGRLSRMERRAEQINAAHVAAMNAVSKGIFSEGQLRIIIGDCMQPLRERLVRIETKLNISGINGN